MVTVGEETAAERWDREAMQRPNGEADPMGRTTREYRERGGDWYMDGSGNLVLAPDGRNEREYVNKETGVSAVSGTVYPDYADLEGS